MQKVTRWTLLGGSAWLAGPVPAACRQAARPGTQGTEPPRLQAPAKVRIMGTFVDEQQGRELWERWKREIAEREPGLEAEFIVQPRADVLDKLLAQVAAGDAPDVTQGTTIEYAVRGLLADRTPSSSATASWRPAGTSRSRSRPRSSVAGSGPCRAGFLQWCRR
jgi:ABC-type glycerol-3-phosphate transport system substrate-binding protein